MNRAASTRAARSALVLVLVLACAQPPAVADEGRGDPHHTAAALHARLEALAAAYPARARLLTLAASLEGRPIDALEIAIPGPFQGGAPVLLVYGGVHGNEWVATEVVLHLCERLLAAPPAALAGLEVHLVPAVNIDGFARGSRIAAGIPDGGVADPNRDFPVPPGPDAPSGPVAQALKDYSRRGAVAGALDYHADAECILWPWAYTRAREPDGIDDLKRVADEMARDLGYCRGQTSRVISYPHQGTAQDWLHHFALVPTLLVELGDQESPGHPALATVLIDQERAFLRFARFVKARAGRR